MDINAPAPVWASHQRLVVDDSILACLWRHVYVHTRRAQHGRSDLDAAAAAIALERRHLHVKPCLCKALQLDREDVGMVLLRLEVQQLGRPEPRPSASPNHRNLYKDIAKEAELVVRLVRNWWLLAFRDWWIFRLRRRAQLGRSYLRGRRRHT